MALVLWLLVVTCAVIGRCESDIVKRGTSSIDKFGLTEAETKKIVDLHNKWRSGAHGKDIYKIEWDDNLALDAMYWADKCKFGHGYPPKPLFTEGKTGQNIGYTTQSSADKYSTFREWMGEGDYYDFDSNECYWEPCKHYTQAMWYSHKKIGCAYHICDIMYTASGLKQLDKKAKYLVCNYYPEGNVYSGRPWSPGDHCGSCPYCEDKLCVTRKHYLKNTSKCKCMKKCQHCGTLTSDCQCKCPKGTYGDECQTFCRDELPNCSAYSKSKCGDGSSVGKILAQNCHALCGTCEQNKDTSWKCGSENYVNTFVRYASSPQYGYKTSRGQSCKFPFVYKGKFHDKCIGKPGKAWCSISTNYDKYRTWSKSCRVIKTTGGNAGGAACVFPFKHDNKYWQQCLLDPKTKKRWCGTTEDFDKDKKYGNCVLTGSE